MPRPKPPRSIQHGADAPPLAGEVLPPATHAPETVAPETILAASAGFDAPRETPAREPLDLDPTPVSAEHLTEVAGEPAASSVRAEAAADMPPPEVLTPQVDSYEPAPQPHDHPPLDPPPAGRIGFWTGFLGGLLGAAVLGGLGLFFVPGIAPNPALVQRVNLLEQSVAPLDQLRTDTAALTTRINEIDQASRDTRTELGVLGDRLNQTLSGAVPGDNSVTGDVRARVAALEQRLAGEPTPPPAEGQTVTSDDKTSGQPPVLESIDALNKAIAGQVAATTSLGERIGQIEAATTSLRERLDASPLNPEEAASLRAAADAATAATVALKPEVEGVAARERSLALAVVVEGMGASLIDGSPFAATLGVLNGMAGDDADLKAAADQLAPLADAGVPTAEKLRAELDAIAPEIISGAQPAPSSDWLESAKQTVTGLVAIKSEGAPDNPRQIAIEDARTALSSGDVAGAIAALKPVADAGSTAAAGWIASAEPRAKAVAAEAVLRQKLESAPKAGG